MESACLAAIDIGTNSCRLLITRPGHGTVVRVSEITRLGEGVDQTKVLSEAAMQRTLNVLKRYGDLIARHGVDRLRIASTSACRDAQNCSLFFDRAQAVLGTRPEVLSGEEEGQLSYRGAVDALGRQILRTQAADGDTSSMFTLVFDLGGGSTELCFGRQGGAVVAAASHTLSVNVGCVRVQEMFLQADPRPSAQDLAEAESFSRSEISQALHRHGLSDLLSQVDVVVGVAGTMTTLAAIDCELEHYDPSRIHGYILKQDAFEKIYQRLAALTTEERRTTVRGLEPGRAEVILGGCAVLAGLIELLPTKSGTRSILISEGDILDALAATGAETC